MNPGWPTLARCSQGWAFHAVISLGFPSKNSKGRCGTPTLPQTTRKGWATQVCRDFERRATRGPSPLTSLHRNPERNVEQHTLHSSVWN